MNRNIFEDLFVLELANNHLGQVERGLRIISEYGKVVRFNNIRAAIKLQFRDVDNFIHKDFRQRSDVRYIKKTLATKLTKEQYGVLVEAIRKNGCIPMVTPFDEISVDWCLDLNIPIIKIASADLNDWFLIERIAATRRPVIISTGGSSEKDLDELVTFFENRNIPLAINHCVSIYPSEDHELELNQIDYLKHRYPGHIIGFSSHEYHDWTNSMLIAYAKGARTFERHIDIATDGVPVSPYCSLPYQVDTWFKAFKKAKDMSGHSAIQKRIPLEKEIQYLDGTIRGVYAKRDLPSGYVFRQEYLNEDLYLAIPLLKGQLSCREIMAGEVLTEPISKHCPVMVEMVDSPYAHDVTLKEMISNRGIHHTAPLQMETEPLPKVSSNTPESDWHQT